MSTSSAHIDTFAHDHLPPRDQWPDLVFTLPELHYPGHINIVTELLDSWVSQDHGHHPAILSATGTLTYKQLQTQVETLQGRVEKTSQTSSKPPSSDSPFDKPKRKQRQSSGKRGGQKGHPGKGPTLLSPTEVHLITPGPCACGHGELVSLAPYFSY